MHQCGATVGGFFAGADLCHVRSFSGPEINQVPNVTAQTWLHLCGINISYFVEIEFWERDGGTEL